MKIPFFTKPKGEATEVFSIFPETIYKSGVASLQDVIAPAALEINPSFLRLGEKLVRTIFIFSYPRYLNTNWFSPVINLDKVFDISFFVHPVDTSMMLRQLQKHPCLLILSDADIPLSIFWCLETFQHILALQ